MPTILSQKCQAPPPRYEQSLWVDGTCLADGLFGPEAGEIAEQNPLPIDDPYDRPCSSRKPKGKGSLVVEDDEYEYEY